VVCFGEELVVGRDYLEKQPEELEMEMKRNRKWKEREEKFDQLKVLGTDFWKVKKEQTEMPCFADL
jgi:hypothetical protein